MGLTDADFNVKLKNEVIRKMIDDKVVSLTKKLVKEAKNKSSIYDHAENIQDKTLEAYHNYAQSVAKDSTVDIYFNELTGEYTIDETSIPIILRNNHSQGHSGKWHTIRAKTLKEEMESRGQEIGEREGKTELEKKSERILKEVSEKLEAQKKKKTTKKKVAKKKTPRKKKGK